MAFVNQQRPVEPALRDWQGNFRGPLDNYGGGYRFESMGQFLGMLCMDAYEQRRQEQIAEWERE
jgi:hypothetical protein